MLYMKTWREFISHQYYEVYVSLTLLSYLQWNHVLFLHPLKPSFPSLLHIYDLKLQCNFRFRYSRVRTIFCMRASHIYQLTACFKLYRPQQCAWESSIRFTSEQIFTQRIPNSTDKKQENFTRASEFSNSVLLLEGRKLVKAHQPAPPPRNLSKEYSSSRDSGKPRSRKEVVAVELSSSILISRMSASLE